MKKYWTFFGKIKSFCVFCTNLIFLSDKSSKNYWNLIEKINSSKKSSEFLKCSKNVLKLLWNPKSHLKFSKIPLKILTFYLKTFLQSHPHPINIVNFIKHPPFHSLSKIDIDSDKHKKKAMNANFIATFSSLLLHFISSNVNWHFETMFFFSRFGWKSLHF